MKKKTTWPLVVVFSGLFYGMLMLILFRNLSLVWASFCVLAMVSPFVVVIVGDVKRLLWCGLVYGLIVNFDITIGHTGHVGGAGGYIISFYDIILFVLYVIWFSEITQNRNNNIKFFPSLSVPAVGLIGTACLSMAFAQFPHLSKYEIIEVMKMYLSFFYLANNIQIKEDVIFLVVLLLGGLFIEGVLGILQHRFDSPILPYMYLFGGPSFIDSRVCGTWGSCNDFAWYLCLVIPLGVSLLFAQIKGIYITFCLFTITAASGSLIWTSTRAGWIASGVACVLVTLWGFMKIKGRSRLINRFIIILLIIVCISPLYPRLYNKTYTRFFGYDGGSADSRWPQYVLAFRIMENHFFTGIGINNYTEIMHNYDVSREGIEFHTSQPVHNIFLHIATEMGILGLLFFIWFISEIFRKGTIYVVKNDDILSNVIIGILGGMIGFLIQGMLHPNSLGNKLFLYIWFYSGMVYAISNITPNKRRYGI